MAACENSYTDNSNVSTDIVEEIEAIKVIFEGQITSYIDNKCVKVTFADERILITFTINGNYPDESPQIEVTHCICESNYILNALEKCATENLGNQMLYDLITKTLELITDVAAPVVETRPQCKFFIQGDCKFGEKCFNLHGQLPENVDEGTENSERTSVTQDSTLANENDNLCKSKLKHSKAENDIHASNAINNESGNDSPNLSDDDLVRGVKKKSRTGEKKKTKAAIDDFVINEKKKPMKTATDVIHRIMWDDSFPTENFIVGYLDRFLGIQEKPFTAFSWEDIASVDYNVLAIPKHRIQYFKYKTVIIWDKTQRLDNVFGSTGGSISIMDIINDESIPEFNLNDDDEEEEEVVDKVYYDQTHRPNYFMCLRIDNKEVKENIIKIQDGITFYDERLKLTLLKPSDFHITLVTMRLNSESDYVTAGDIMKQLQSILVCMFNAKTSFLKLQGVSDFRGQVVIAEVVSNPLFNKFVEIAKLKLKDNGILLVSNHEPYSPHITMLKLNRTFCRDESMESINNLYYSEFKDFSFGNQPLDEIRLCSTKEDRGDDGFYVTLSTISSNLFHVHSKLPSLISAFVQELMSAGLILEDVGDDILSELLSDDPHRFKEVLLSLEDMLPSFSSFYSRRKRHVIIMRGLPGSGKTYFVQKLKESSPHTSFSVCSSDHFFQDGASQYKYSDEKIASAHSFCRNNFIDSISKNCNIIAVDNTHTMTWEYQIYQRIALLCGYTSHVVSINCDDEEARNEFYHRCQRNMKPYVHKEMAQRWQTDDESIFIDSDGSSIDMNDLLNHGSLLSLTSSSILYSALYLDESSQQLLLSCYPPVHERVACDHVTLTYEPSLNDLSNVSVGEEKSIRVTGFIVNNSIQAVLVSDVIGEICSSKKPHVTISTSKSTPPKDVQRWIDNQPCIPPKYEIILTGAVGVQVATSKTKSKKCLHVDEFSAILSKLLGGEQACNGHHKNRLSSMEELPVIDPGLYFGPNIIKSLFVFDFDGTLFHTPDPAEGRMEYQRATGRRWPHRGWLANTESILYPLHLYPGPSLRDYFEHYGRAGTTSVLLTGRQEKIRSSLELVLITHSLSFDKVILKPEYSPGVNQYKKGVVKNLMKELPHLESVKFWDDREDNIQRIKSLGKEINNVKIETFHVSAVTPILDNMTVSGLLDRMGIRPFAEFKAGVEEGLDYISGMCKDVFGITDKRQILFPFGSYLLERRGDVDVCLLLPSHLSVDHCVEKLGEKAKDYGIECVYVASGIRVPIIKIKLKYLNAPPIDFDIVMAAVLDKDDDGLHDFDFEMLHKKCSDKKSKAALDGLLFFEEVVVPSLDRINLTEFGMIVDIINIILKKKNLKGNVFHCIRTFHIVQLLSQFIQCCAKEILPEEGLERLKEWEHFLNILFKYLSRKKTQEYRELFNGFVPEMYIEPLQQCFLESSAFKILDLLCTAPRPATNVPNITFELQSSNKALLWSALCLTEAKVGMCIHDLIKQGVTIYPISSTSHNVISFNAVPLSQCKHTVMRLKEELSLELPHDVNLKVQCHGM